jgi:putative transposase
MTVREIKRFLEEQYRVEVSADLVSTVNDSVMEDALEWQSLPLEPMYIVVFFDALRVKIRGEGSVRNKLGIQRDGTKDVLGLWIQQDEGAKFWAAVMNELKHRRIAVVDGFKGFPEAITAVFPETETQPCIVHLIRTPSATGSSASQSRRCCRAVGRSAIASLQFLLRLRQIMFVRPG